MQPYSNLGIRNRRGKKMGAWWLTKKKSKDQPQEPEIPEQQPTEVSGFFKKLLRGEK